MAVQANSNLSSAAIDQLKNELLAVLDHPYPLEGQSNITESPAFFKGYLQAWISLAVNHLWEYLDLETRNRVKYLNRLLQGPENLEEES